MAVNPMQRRTRNSFLAGFLIALIIAVVAVAACVYKIMGLNEDLSDLEKLQTIAYVLMEDVKSGGEITRDSFETQFVRTTATGYLNDALMDDLFSGVDNDGNEIERVYSAKIDLTAGMLVTPEMLVEKGDETSNDMRIQEYNMIMLPTELVAGDYIDIRLKMPEGEDYIVVSKKQVKKANLDTIWLKMNEEEILAVGNAIVEAYIIEGAKVYATKYVDAGLQTASEPTYAVSPEVLSAMRDNPNMTKEAKDALSARYQNQNHVTQRNNVIGPQLDKYTDEDKNKAVLEGIQTEFEKLQESREQYLTELGEI